MIVCRRFAALVIFSPRVSWGSRPRLNICRRFAAPLPETDWGCRVAIARPGLSTSRIEASAESVGHRADFVNRGQRRRRGRFIAWGVSPRKHRASKSPALKGRQIVGRGVSRGPLTTRSRDDGVDLDRPVQGIAEHWNPSGLGDEPLEMPAPQAKYMSPLRGSWRPVNFRLWGRGPKNRRKPIRSSAEGAADS